MTKVNINKATAQQLQELKYVGIKTAQWIIAGRPYKDVHELSGVKGIGKVKMAYFLDNDLIEV